MPLLTAGSLLSTKSACNKHEIKRLIIRDGKLGKAEWGAAYRVHF
jgi:hypothetical protein